MIFILVACECCLYFVIILIICMLLILSCFLSFCSIFYFFFIIDLHAQGLLFLLRSPIPAAAKKWFHLLHWHVLIDRFRERAAPRGWHMFFALATHSHICKGCALFKEIQTPFPHSPIYWLLPNHLPKPLTSIQHRCGSKIYYGFQRDEEHFHFLLHTLSVDR